MAKKCGDASDIDLFKDEFKRYKKRKPAPDLSEVIDFSNPGKFLGSIEKFELSQPNVKKPYGLKDVEEWKAFRLKSNPGFLLICNPFEKEYQRYWVKRCLRDFPVKPNHTNLDIHMKLTDQDNIWLDNNIENSNPFPKGSVLSHLRWATLGYHYEWNNQLYFEDKVSEFPSDLSELTKYIASTLGYPEFSPQSGITNYYNMESALCGHTDHSEYDKRAPLISYSFGQSAVFLIGGPTKSQRPVALYLRSGDICVMMEEARLSYHAVPRIVSAEPDKFREYFSDKEEHEGQIPNSEEESVRGLDKTVTEMDQDNFIDPDPTLICSDDKYRKDCPWQRYEKYLKTARINLNVRQVLENGKTFPKSNVPES